MTVCPENGNVVWRNMKELFNSKIEVDVTRKAVKEKWPKLCKQTPFFLWPIAAVRKCEHIKCSGSFRPTLTRTKNLYENGPNPFFFFFFQSYGNDTGPDSYSSQIRLRVS